MSLGVYRRFETYRLFATNIKHTFDQFWQIGRIFRLNRDTHDW